jgi:hypothetical protein
MRSLGIAVSVALLGCTHGRSMPPSPGGPAPTLSVDGQPLVAASADVLVDPAATGEESQRVVGAYAAARAAMAEALGPSVSEPPLAIFCKAPHCAAAFAGATKRSYTLPKGTRFPNGATAWRPTIVILRMDAGAQSFAEHEMVHREMYARLRGARVPAWFAEGLAALVADAPTCPPVPEDTVDDLRRLAGPQAWSGYTDFRTVPDGTYCQAKAEVGAWRSRFGRQRLLDLLEGVGAGSSFESLYGPLVNAPARARLTPLVTPSTDFSDARHGFSLALWIKPRENAGVLADLSETPIGSGWCAPLLGFDGTQHLVAQLLANGGPGLSNYTLARAPEVLPLESWAHLAMTWAPGGRQRLYVNGTLAAEVPAGVNFADGQGAPMYVTWGSYNLAGVGRCWPGGVGPGDFRGALAGMRVAGEEWSPEQIRQLAADHP